MSSHHDILEAYYTNHIAQLKNKCTWIKTEANHDFATGTKNDPALFGAINLRPYSKGGSAKLLATLQKNITFCSNPELPNPTATPTATFLPPGPTENPPAGIGTDGLITNQPLVDDEKIVQLVFGGWDKSFFKEMPPQQWTTLKVNTISTPGTRDSLGPTEWKTATNFTAKDVLMCCKIETADMVQYNDPMKLFEHILEIPRYVTNEDVDVASNIPPHAHNSPDTRFTPNTIWDKHIYIIEDTPLWKLFNKSNLKNYPPPPSPPPSPPLLPTPDKKYHFHFINSAETIGDSASKRSLSCMETFIYNYIEGDPAVVTAAGLNQNRYFSWIYERKMEIPSNDPLMISSFHITGHFPDTAISGINTLSVNQIWKPENVPGYTTEDTFINTNKTNNKPAVREDIINILKGGPGQSSFANYLKKPASTTSVAQTVKDNRISKAFQRKRSGDYLQIRFAKLFPQTLLQHKNEFKLLLPSYSPTGEFNNLAVNNRYPPITSGIISNNSTPIEVATAVAGGTVNEQPIWYFPPLPPGGGQPYNIPHLSNIGIRDQGTSGDGSNGTQVWSRYFHAYNINLTTEAIIRNNTFLVTLDWPCLCYAIFNKVNVIFFNNTPGNIGIDNVPTGDMKEEKDP